QAAAPGRPFDTAWLPLPCSSSDMNAAAMQYGPRRGWCRRDWRGSCGRGAAPVLGAEGGHVAQVAVQVLAAGQAPGPAHHGAVLAADPESGRVGPAVDAQREGV